ncbi:hypothetical protein LWI29_006905 [Acer saccharum]|uniref:Uncharacterized protein n=1 Tax=Acer saccharum TaxID=4024 RepID=A0AA39SLQ8_ACESA|nr:hypothetical protein LWI29_006905 [Acer saccharum]
MCEGESSKKIRVLVHVPSVNLKQRDLGGEGQEATKLEGIVTEEVVINEERLKEKDGEQRDSVVGGISSGPLLVAHENLGSLDNKGYGSIDVSVNGPHLEMDKVRSNFKLSKFESLNGRFFDSCGSGSKFKKVVVRATGFSKRYSGSELKLGISGEKFKVHGGKQKLELAGKGDSVRRGNAMLAQKNQVADQISECDARRRYETILAVTTHRISTRRSCDIELRLQSRRQT